MPTMRVAVAEFALDTLLELANVPRYTLTFTDYEGQPISIYSPDCAIHLGGPPSRLRRLGLPLGGCQATPNPWQVIYRNAMSTLPTRRSPRTYLAGGEGEA
jgi:hypothetical protein